MMQRTACVEIIQEWCKGVGVIPHEKRGVEAIKAWVKELMGWWLGWGFERKGRYLSLRYAKKRLCL